MIEAKIAEADMRSLRRNAGLYGALIVVSLVVSVVAFAQENWLAFATAALMYALSLYFAFAFDRDKRKYDVKTYREVRALCNGASLEEIKAQRVPEHHGVASLALREPLMTRIFRVSLAIPLRLPFLLLGNFMFLAVMQLSLVSFLLLRNTNYVTSIVK